MPAHGLSFTLKFAGRRRHENELLTLCMVFPPYGSERCLCVVTFRNYKKENVATHFWLTNIERLNRLSSTRKTSSHALSILRGGTRALMITFEDAAMINSQDKLTCSVKSARTGGGNFKFAVFCDLAKGLLIFYDKSSGAGGKIRVPSLLLETVKQKLFGRNKTSRKR
jgi:hypothetical protein